MPDHEAAFDRAHGGAQEDRGTLRAGIGDERRDQPRRIEEAVASVERPAADPLRPDERNHRGDLVRLEPPGLDAEAPLELGGIPQPSFARLCPGQHQVARLMEAQPSDGPFERLQLDDRESREGDVDLGRELRPDAAVGEGRGASADGRRRLEHGHVEPGTGQFACARQADHAGADHGNVGPDRHPPTLPERTQVSGGSARASSSRPRSWQRTPRRSAAGAAVPLR